MVQCKESPCDNSVWESLTYTCDECNKTTFTVKSMEDFNDMFEIFDEEVEGHICLKCTGSVKIKKEVEECKFL